MKTKRMQTLATLLFFCLSLSGKANAHGNTEPQHGGVVKIMGEYTIELVRHPNLSELYLAYDGEDMQASQLSAMLKVDVADSKEKLTLVAGENNRFYIQQGIADGSTVIAMVTLADGYSKIVAKFKL